jgi:hypothetical protein
MMTTAQLAQRLAQKMWGEDFSRLSMTQAEELRDGINIALDEFGGFLPAHRKVRSVPFVVESSKSVSVEVTAASSTIVIATSLPISTVYAAPADLVGRGLVLAGAPNLNRLISSTALLLPWIGSTSTVAGTLYADGIPLPARADQLAGEVTFLKEGTTEPALLHPRQDFPSTSLHANASTQIGEPAVWWLDSFGGHDAQEISLILRLWPLPSVRGTLTVKLKQFAAPVTLDDLNVTSRSLPVDTTEQGHLVAICAEHLLTASGLRKDLNPAAISVQAASVRTLLSNRANSNPAAVPNRVGTPQGW